jgi:hypothetical protein
VHRSRACCDVRHISVVQVMPVIQAAQTHCFPFSESPLFASNRKASNECCGAKLKLFLLNEKLLTVLQTCVNSRFRTESIGAQAEAPSQTLAILMKLNIRFKKGAVARPGSVLEGVVP